MQFFKPALCAMAFACLFATLVVDTAHGQITVQSQPEHAHVRFRGPVSIEGVTPLSLDHFPPGDYLLRATGLGLVTARGRLRSTLDQRVTVQRWARPYAFLMPAGFVHMARSDKWRGIVFTTAAAGGTLGAIVKNAHHDNAQADLDLAQTAYDRAATEDDITMARLNLETASEREQDEARMRSIWIGYTAASWVGAALEAWLLTSPPGVRPQGGGSFEIDVPRGRPGDAALRSVLVPGSGQRHMGHYWKGVIFGASVYGLVAGTITAYDEYLEAKRKQSDAQRRYDAATTTADLEPLRSNLEKTSDDASSWKVTVWSLAGTAGAVYIWNVLDAMGLGATGWEPSGVEVGLAPSPDGVLASLTWRMP